MEKNAALKWQLPENAFKYLKIRKVLDLQYQQFEEFSTHFQFFGSANA